MTILSDFLQAATPAERDRLAAATDTSVNYLRQIAGRHRCRVSVHFAVKLEKITIKMNHETQGRLPAISAEALSAMCKPLR